jgi:hypothetical protein
MSIPYEVCSFAEVFQVERAMGKVGRLADSALSFALNFKTQRHWDIPALLMQIAMYLSTWIFASLNQ